MEWVCRKCGTVVTAGAVDLLHHTRWLITSPGRGICPSCVKEAALLGDEEEILRAARSLNRRQPRQVAARIVVSAGAEKTGTE